MKKILGLLIFLCSFNTLANNILKVAVIDTGFNPKYSNQANLCESGHKDFSGEGLFDYNGHGTNVIGLIVKHSSTKNYCIIIIKAFAMKSPKTKSYIVEALQYAYDIKADIINLSAGGEKPISSEKRIVMKILNKKQIFVTAAGNNGKNLDKACTYYPACYDKRIIVVGDKNKYSNYGKYVDAIQNGKNQTAFGQTMSGTSQSTAIFTGLLL